MADQALVVDLRDRRDVSVDPTTGHRPRRRRGSLGGRRCARVAPPPGGRRWHGHRHRRWRPDARWRDRLAVRDPGLHLRQPRPRRARDRRRRTGRGRSGRRSGASVGAARRRRQLRRGHELRVPGDRSRADPGRLHPLPDQCRQAGPSPARGRGRDGARRARADGADRPARRGRSTVPCPSASGSAGPATSPSGRRSCDRCGPPCRRSRTRSGRWNIPPSRR